MATCGNCKNHHVSVSHIRQCYHNRYTQSGTVILPQPKTLSENQLRKVRKDAGAVMSQLHEEANRLATFTRGADPVAGTQYNGLIGYRVDPALEAQVPVGRYAIRSADTGTVRFYRVDKPTKGRWAGRTFVKVQASDDLFPIYGAHKRAEVLRAIAADVRAASVLYGRELGRCGVCGRTLTDEQSRAAGIGPVCASKL